MSLANIPNYFRSKGDQIQLVLLCTENNLKNFGFDKILQRTISDIQIIEKFGITVDSVTFYGSLFCVLGDNLGSHQIGGFMESFSNSEYFCRFCLTTQNDFQNNKRKPGILRTPENYNSAVQNLKLNKCLNHYTGIKQDSCLNRLQFFNVCDPGLPPCIAHDIFEGVLQYDLALAISYFINNKWLSLECLNFKLQNIKFYKEQNYQKPITIKKSKKLHGSASQNLQILRMLPFAFYDSVKYNKDPVWQMILLLLHICQLIKSYNISVGQVALLKNLLQEYINFRQSNFPNVNLRPKHHYILHYADMIQKFGPLNNFCTLRYESKHRYFKNRIKHMLNFKNITYTLAEKHQLLQAVYDKNKSLFTDKIIAEEVTCYNSENVGINLGINHIIDQLSYKRDFKFITRKIVYRGVKYEEGMFVATGRNDIGHLEAMKIQFIFINEIYTSIYFLGQLYQLKLSYMRDNGLYEFFDKNCFSTVCVSYNNLSSVLPLLVQYSKDNVLFSLKQSFLEPL